jgi:hypothetical protein
VSFTMCLFILTTGGSMLQADPNEKKRKRVRQDVDPARLSSPTQRSTNLAYNNLLPGDQVWLNSNTSLVFTSSMRMFYMKKFLL